MSSNLESGCRGSARWGWLLVSLCLITSAAYFLYPSLERFTAAGPEVKPASLEIVEHPVAPIKPTVTPVNIPVARPIRPSRTPAQPIRQVSPSVPEGVRNRIDGMIRVSVKVQIGASGNVTQAKPIGKMSGLQAYLAQRAVEAARQWKFRPARLDRKAVSDEAIVRFRFRKSETAWN